jgi:anthranilate phosphoribosyltransferase
LLLEDDLSGGSSIEANAKIFMNILEGHGTKEQNRVVVANAALALQCINQSESLSGCLLAAQESLNSGKALESLKKLLALN